MEWRYGLLLWSAGTDMPYVWYIDSNPDGSGSPNQSPKDTAADWTMPRDVLTVALLNGVLLVITVVSCILFSPYSSACILPAPISQYAVTPDYEVPDSGTPSAGPGPQQPLTYPSPQPAIISPLPGEPGVLGPTSCLIIQNASDQLVMLTAGGESYSLRPGAQIGVVVTSGWQTLSVRTPGSFPALHNVLLRPYQTYVCTFHPPESDQST